MNIEQIDTEIRHTTPADGNVFEDLGFAPAEAHKLKIKSELMIHLSEWIKANHLEQDQAAQCLHISKLYVADIMHGQVEKFTIDALVDMLEQTGQRVTLSVHH